MVTARRYRSAAAWGVAGVPILLTLVQTALALVRTSGYAVFGGLVDVFHSLAVFDAAAPVFRESTGLVLVLFALIALGWAGQGAAMFVTRTRDAAFAAAGLTAVLFFALFLGVYAPLFGADVPALQLVAFFTVPVVAAGAAVAAALVHDWDTDVVDEASGALVAAETAVADARDGFERALDARVGDVATLRTVAPAAADAASDGRSSFRDRCEAVQADLQAVRERESDPDELRRHAAELEARADSLDPDAAADATEESVREALADAARADLSTVLVRSRWDRSYELVNLPARFREVHVGAFGTDVHVSHLADAVTSRLDGGIDVRTVVEGFSEITAHVGRVESYLAEREAEFADATEAVEDDLSAVESKVERFDGAVGERLSEYLVDGRHEAIDGVRDARETLATARDALLDCRFQDATRAVDAAGETARHLLRLAEFLGAVAGSIEHGRSTVSLPDGVEPAVVRDLQPAFERAYGVEFDVADGRIELAGGERAGRDDGAETGTAPSADESSGDGSSPGARPDEVIDSVLYVVRELERAAREAEAEIQLQTADLPESVADSAALDHLESFARRQTDVVASVDLQPDAPPGFLTVVPADGTPPGRVAAALHERFRDRYGEGR